MLKTTNLHWWIGHYFGLNCILHPGTGRWVLTGYFDGQVVCHRETTNIDEDDCLMCPISEVQFILKFANPFLIKSLCKLPLFYQCMHNKALEGYWVFDDTSINVIYEANGPSTQS